MQDWLLNELKRRGWSQRELARRAGLPQSTLSQAISGKRKISPEVCAAIALALGESPAHIMALAGLLPPQSPDDNATIQELTELVRQLSPEMQKDILDYVRFRYRQERGQ